MGGVLVDGVDVDVVVVDVVLVNVVLVNVVLVNVVLVNVVVVDEDAGAGAVVVEDTVGVGAPSLCPMLESVSARSDPAHAAEASASAAMVDTDRNDSESMRKLTLRSFHVAALPCAIRSAGVLAPPKRQQVSALPCVDREGRLALG